MKSFEELRYSGDRAKDYLQAGPLGLSPREKKARRAFYHQNMVEVLPELLPKLSAVFEGVKDRLGVGPGVECFVQSDSELGAFCHNLGDSFGSGEEPLVAVVLNSALVNLLTDEELAVIIGHELGHYFFSHRLLPNPSEGAPSLERLQAKQLSRAAEISADRIGFISCPDLSICFRAMLKTESGLSDEHLRGDVSAYLDQLRDNRSVLEHSDEIWSTHPMFPLRVKALKWFCMSQAYYDWVGKPGPPISTEKMDSMIEKDFSSICGMQSGELQSGVEHRVKLWGALRLFVADNRLTRQEQDVLEQFFGKETADSAVGFLQGQPQGQVVPAVQAKLNEVLGEAQALTLEKKDSIVRDFEKFSGAAGGGTSTIIETLTTIARRLGISRAVRMLRIEDPEE